MKIVGKISTHEVWLDGKKLNISKSQKIRTHSFDFNWGYCGSGPAQLALAILLEKLSEKDAVKYYQQFKLEHVSSWGQSDFDVKLDFETWLLKVKTKGFKA